MTGKLTRGIIHGRRIELSDDLGLTDGQEVEVRVTIVARPRPWGEGILRSAGGWADYPGMDAVLDQIQQNRKAGPSAPDGRTANFRHVPAPALTDGLIPIGTTSTKEENPWSKILRGAVHGRTIELETKSGIEDGRESRSSCDPRRFPAPARMATWGHQDGRRHDGRTLDGRR